MIPTSKRTKIPFTLWQHRELIIEITRRELNQRYRGSFLDFLWSLIVPLGWQVVGIEQLGKMRRGRTSGR